MQPRNLSVSLTRFAKGAFLLIVIAARIAVVADAADKAPTEKPGSIVNSATGQAASNAASNPAEAEVPQPIQGKDYRLVFRDEFNGVKGAPPDPKKWSHMQRNKWRDLWNVEDACLQDGEGNLRIEVRKNGDRFETGYIGTAGKFLATHGYFEARCRLQKEKGFWSAFWLTSPTYGKDLQDPVNSGVEIDVMEYLAWYGDEIPHAAHWNGYKEDHKIHHFKTKVPGVSKGFHTFAVKWDETGYVFYIDGVDQGRWPDTVPISNAPSYILLTCESEKWAGDITKANLPDDYLVDYVRVWQTPAQIEADRQRQASKPKQP